MAERFAALQHDRLELYRRMWVLRLLDMALEELRIEGLIHGPLQAGFGQEAVGIGASGALREEDVIITAHRPHAQYVGRGSSLGPLIANMMCRLGGCQNGASPPVGATYSPLLAVGHAYSQWLEDDSRVTLCATTDSDMNASVFGEVANMAVVWQLPLVILVEDVRCALSVRLDSRYSANRLYRRAPAYGMPGVSVDGNDVEAVRDCVATAVERARVGGGPTLVQAITYRTTDFSGSDRGGYRDLAGSEQFLDPLVFARRRLLAAGASCCRLEGVERVARQLVADAVMFAKANSRTDCDGLDKMASNSDGQAESLS